MQYTHQTLTSAPTTIGVYAIRNTVNGKQYIGSASQFERRNRGFRFRWREHLRDLVAGRHHSQKLQRAWDKYGADSFVFEVREVVEPCGGATREALLRAEQRHMDSCGIRAGYNVNPTAGSQLGYKHSDETKKKIGDAVRGLKKSPETIAKMKAYWAARKAAGEAVSEETRARMSAAAKLRMEDPVRRAALVAQARAASSRSKGVPRQKGRKLSDEAKAKMRAAHAMRLSDPDPARTEKHRSAMEARRGVPMSAETKERMRLAAIERSKNPEYIKRMADGVRRAHAERAAREAVGG